MYTSDFTALQDQDSAFGCPHSTSTHSLSRQTSTNNRTPRCSTTSPSWRQRSDNFYFESQNMNSNNRSTTVSSVHSLPPQWLHCTHRFLDMRPVAALCQQSFAQYLLSIKNQDARTEYRFSEPRYSHFNMNSTAVKRTMDTPKIRYYILCWLTTKTMSLTSSFFTPAYNYVEMSGIHCHPGSL